MEQDLALAGKPASILSPPNTTDFSSTPSFATLLDYISENSAACFDELDTVAMSFAHVRAKAATKLMKKACCPDVYSCAAAVAPNA